MFKSLNQLGRSLCLIKFVVANEWLADFKMSQKLS